MLLTVPMASIPCLSRQPIPDSKQSHIPSSTPANTPSLQYFNIRVRERLHRYRSIKRQWNEVASTSQFDSSKTDSSAPVTEMTPITHEQLIKDYITASSLKEKDSTSVNPLHSQIEKDIIELRKLMKSRQKKRSEKSTSKGNTHRRPSGENVSSFFFFSSRTCTNFIMIKVYFHFSAPVTRPVSAPVCRLNERKKGHSK